MKPRQDAQQWRRFYILDEKNRPVQVTDHDEWSRWMADNDLVFRRTLLEQSGGMVTTRFRGVSEAAPTDTPLFITRVTGLAEQDNESFGAQTLDAALEEHERIVQKLLRQPTGR
ncbi:hypothetical protein CNE_2c09360 [Cupriavidus necator N-1]|uniref:Uncharacterized protein n=1 Tax=Cupriavidus necator (strain ATCC 43291 / DSM 13513 / CCUG 52238 / LMG 8453 / N-1) TaxID=1042878 RepID=F8GT69_CUPNN|nr:hypothetical protein [Cupriavidus necator]AEI79908.1 hypothetical protein CNE_2c09360 [Cupriavidus necator N-1]MDX6010459.1 hypothetical protein [Cupriavidus necator]